MCNHKLKRLFYTSDDDYDIQTCRVELEEDDEKHTLSYCEKCGQVFVMEIAEKDEICVGDEVAWIVAPDKGKAVVLSVLQSEGCKNLVDVITPEEDIMTQIPIGLLAKTGRHFDEIEELLKKMKGES